MVSADGFKTALISQKPQIGKILMAGEKIANLLQCSVKEQHCDPDCLAKD